MYGGRKMSYTKRWFEILKEVLEELRENFLKNYRFTQDEVIDIVNNLLIEENKDRRNSDRKNDKATPQQLKYIAKLGVVNLPEGLTKDEASELIDKALQVKRR